MVGGSAGTNVVAALRVAARPGLAGPVVNRPPRLVGPLSRPAVAAGAGPDRPDQAARSGRLPGTPGSGARLGQRVGVQPTSSWARSLNRMRAPGQEVELTARQERRLRVRR